MEAFDFAGRTKLLQCSPQTPGWKALIYAVHFFPDVFDLEADRSLVFYKRGLCWSIDYAGF